MLIAAKKKSPIVFNDPSKNAVESEMKYLVLHVTEDEHGPVKLWELLSGRQAVVDNIYDIFKENGYYNFFRSNIVSEKIEITRAISAYTFIRRFLESGEITLDAWGIKTVDDFNDYILSDDSCVDAMNLQGIVDMSDLDKYYKADLYHKTMNEVQ